MFSAGQQAAVVGAFKLAGFDGPLLTAPVTSEDERIFLLDHDSLAGLHELPTLEQVLQLVLGRKVWVTARTTQWGKPIPFA